MIRKYKDHPKVLLKRRGKIIEIDEDLAPIIKGCWKNNIETASCCQSSCVTCTKKHKWKMVKYPNGQTILTLIKRCTHLAYIGFHSVPDAEMFLNIIRTNKNSDHILGYGSKIEDPDKWSWHYNREFVNGKCETWAVVTFPRKDIEMIIKAFQ